MQTIERIAEAIQKKQEVRLRRKFVGDLKAHEFNLNLDAKEKKTDIWVARK